MSDWSPADEAAFLAATKAAEAPPAPSAVETQGNRYAAIRRVLKAAAPLSTQEYLLGQLLLVTMDVQAEIAGLRDEIAELNATNLELIVHRRPK